MFSICWSWSMKWRIVAFERLRNARAFSGKSSVEMPITENAIRSSRQASRSSEAISSTQGPHQLAQTLIRSGRPRYSASGREGPFKPRSVASRKTPPIGTSPGVAEASGEASRTSNRRTQFLPNRSILKLWLRRAPIDDR
jgi:hypothetical protein